MATADLNIKRWMESDSYIQQKATVNKDINELKQRYSANGNPYALDRHAAPAQLFVTDYSTFKKTPQEKALLATLKIGIPKSRNHKFKLITHVST